MAKNKDTIEWDLVERDWRAGVKSQALISKEYGVSRAAMQKRFDKLGITRDLGGKVRSAAATKVAQTVAEQAAPQSFTASPASERDIIEANAAMQSQIILQHRSDIQRSRRLSMALLNELEQQTDHLDLIEQLQDALHDPDDKGLARRLELLERLTSLGSRAGTMKSLADTLRSLVALERQAFGLDEKSDEDSGNGIEDAIKRVEEKHGSD